MAHVTCCAEICQHEFLEKIRLAAAPKANLGFEKPLHLASEGCLAGACEGPNRGLSQFLRAGKKPVQPKVWRCLEDAAM